jgi:type IV secretory pathway VirJ component
MHARVIELPGGHHFGGDYDAVARLILQQLGAQTGARG